MLHSGNRFKELYSTIFYSQEISHLITKALNLQLYSSKSVAYPTNHYPLNSSNCGRYMSRNLIIFKDMSETKWAGWSIVHVVTTQILHLICN